MASTGSQHVTIGEPLTEVRVTDTLGSSKGMLKGRKSKIPGENGSTMAKKRSMFLLLFNNFIFLSFVAVDN